MAAEGALMRGDLPTSLRHRGMMGLVTIVFGVVLLAPSSALAGDPLRPDPAPKGKPAPIAPDPAPVAPRTVAPDSTPAAPAVSRSTVTRSPVAAPKPRPPAVKKKPPKPVRHVARAHHPRPIAQPRSSHDEIFRLLPSPASDADRTATLLAVLALAVLLTSSVSLLQLARRIREI